MTLQEITRKFKKYVILAKLIEHEGDTNKVAAELNITIATIYNHGNVPRFMTLKQREICHIIKEFEDLKQAMPTFAEIGARLGISKQAVQHQIASLQKKGFIKHSDRKHRDLETVKEKVYVY